MEEEKKNTPANQQMWSLTIHMNRNALTTRFFILHATDRSPGSCIILLDDTIAFFGNTILNEETFLKFDDGDEELFTVVTVPTINGIKDKVQILLGHGESFMKRDWKKNERTTEK